MAKFSYNLIAYGDEPLEKSIERLHRYGYDAAELVGEPEKFKVDEVTKILDKFGFKVSSICPIFTFERDLISSNEKTRENAIRYTKSVIKFASELGAQVITVGPVSACMKIHPEAPREIEMDRAVRSLTEIGNYAADLKVNLAVEPWNRYETYFINRIEQALELARRVNLENVGVMGDLFHMNIEEPSIPDAIKMAGNKLYHFHIADTNRAAPGRGHLNFEPIINALKSVGYSGYLTMELLPPLADPFIALKGGMYEEFFDRYTKESIDYLRKIWSE